MPTKTVPAASLLLDYNLYPRHRLDTSNLTRIGEALDAGETLPPVIADAASKRVVDGFHRITVVLRRDPDGTIRCEFRDYETEADLFLDAVRANARHGVPLSSYDQARVRSLGAAEGIAIEYDEAAIDETMIRELLAEGGKRVGVGNFSPRWGGPFGRFKVV